MAGGLDLGHLPFGRTANQQTTLSASKTASVAMHGWVRVVNSDDVETPSASRLTPGPCVGAYPASVSGYASCATNLKRLQRPYSVTGRAE